MLKLDFKCTRGRFVLEVNAQLSATSTTAILGRNGSGKTSLLRAIAGLDRVSGEISLNDVKWLHTNTQISVPTRVRNLGFVSQTPKLFPYMTVSQNLRFALQLARKRNKQYSKNVLSDMVEQFELKSLLDRKPATLSGGETSRVVLVRALLSNPDLLLFDEPLATIDVDRKKELLPYLEKILAERPLPMLYVTHDYTEIARLCENTLVLREGSVATCGPTSDVVPSISDYDLQDHSENTSIVNAQYVSYDHSWNLAHFNFGDQSLVIPMTAVPNFSGIVPIRIQDRDVAIAITKPENLSVRNVLECRILEIEQLDESPFVRILLCCGEEQFYARITRASMRELNLENDTKVFALIKSATLEM